MASITGQKNNVKAGMLVVLAILTATAIIIVISNGVEFFGTRKYNVDFTFETGASGLQRGSLILLAGQPVGSVTGIEFTREADQPSGVRVAFRIDDSIELRKGALIWLEQPLLGTQSRVNITGLGDGPALADGEALQGAIAPPSFLAQAGYGEQQADDLRTILSRARDVAESIDKLVGGFDEGTRTSINDTIADARTSAANIREMTDDARGRYDVWAERIDGLTKTLEEEPPVLSQAMKDRLAEIEKLITTAQGYLDDNRTKVDEIVENTRSTTQRADELVRNLDEQTRVELEKLLSDGRIAVADARDSLDRVDGLIIEQTPNIRGSIASARLAADQMKDALVEIRNAPWRLLYRPDMRELENELLYDSARRYAGAVSDLRAVAEALQALAAADAGALDGHEQSVAGLIELLSQSFERYREAEDAFLREIIEDD